jgi:hypothetical protein
MLATSGDTIMVASATYTENLTIGISLNVIGSGASTTIVDGGAANSVVRILPTTTVVLSGLTIRNGQAVHGGGVYNSGDLTITSTTISRNSASGTPTFGAQGGGIYNGGTLTISNSTVSGNVARPGRMCNLFNRCSGGSGGDIYNVATLTINKSTVSGNVANDVCRLDYNYGRHIVCFGGSGGGIDSFGTLTIYNSTVSDNVARLGVACERSSCIATGFGGGIISSSSSSTLTISNSTISGNQGGGIAGSATLQNSIVAHSPGGNCYGTMISNGYNMSSDGTCNFSSSGDWNNTDPLLGSLQPNGGPTQTQALLPGSPAIDAGNPSGCTDGNGHLLKTDQRGYPRPDKEEKTGCDMGAYEK